MLVDGGTDILMRGDENGLGTPVEDLTSVAAVTALDKLAARCLYLDRIENTVGRRQVIGRIEAFRDEIPTTRIPRAYPH